MDVTKNVDGMDVTENVDGMDVTENVDGMDVTENVDGMDVTKNVDGMDVTENVDGMDVTENVDGMDVTKNVDGMDVTEHFDSMDASLNMSSPPSSPCPTSFSSSPSYSSPSTSLDESQNAAQSEQLSDNVLNASLYQNANISLITALLLIMSFTLKHNLTDVALHDLLQLISYFIPKPNILVTSVYNFKKIFKFNQQNSSLIYYCKNCQASFENSLNLECQLCGTERSSKCYFVTLPIKKQIEQMFSRHGFFEAIKHWFYCKVAPDLIADVYDGALYRALSRPGEFLNLAFHISFQWNTDGVPLFRSSSYSMWPMYFKINELPQRMRNGLNNKILAGMWFGNIKPSINTFLKPLCLALKELYTEGVQVHPPELQSPFICKAIVLSGTCDLPAKSMALNMVGHNGFYACPYCEQPGKTLALGSGGHVHIYPYVCENPTDPSRTKRNVEKCSIDSYKTGKRKRGINPPGSCLQTLPHFNLVDGVGIDYMHCVLLNIMRLLINLWFDSSHHFQPWSCSKKVANADNKLLSIKPPSTITRTPRSLTERKYWKVSEYRAFLFYYSLPVMLSLLPTEYFEHFTLLCHGIYM